jgi:hypothetical protein
MRRGDRFDFEICGMSQKFRTVREGFLVFTVFIVRHSATSPSQKISEMQMRDECVRRARDFAKSPSDRRARSEKSSRATRMTQYCALMRFRERDRPGGASIVSGAYLIVRDIPRG